MPERRRGRLRGLLLNAAVGAASAAIVFGLSEGLLRVTSLAPARALRSPDLETLRRIPGIYAPGQDFVDGIRRDLPSRIRINNLGFRGRDLPETKRAGVLRVLALGDSYTFGDHVETEEAWPARLEEELRGRLSRPEPAAPPGAGETVAREVTIGAPREVEVVNGGANGFGILDEEQLWTKAGSRLDPGIVIVAFSPNDISDLTRPVPMIDLMKRNAELKSRPVLGPLLRALQNTAVFNGLQMLAARWRRGAGGNDALPGVEPARAGPEAAPEAWEAYHEAFGRLAARLASEGRRALLVLYPSHVHVTGEEAFHAGSTLPAWAAEAGWPCLDLLAPLRAAAREGRKLYLVPLDSHPAPEAHAVAARAIAEVLEREGWLASP